MIRVDPLVVWTENIADRGLIWSDARDETYVEFFGDGGDETIENGYPDYAAAFLTELVPDLIITSVSLNLRVSATRTDGLPDPIKIEFDLIGSDPGPTPIVGIDSVFIFSSPLLEIPPDGVIRDMAIAVSPGDLPVGVYMADVLTALAGPSPAVEIYYDHWHGGFSTPINRVVRIYEAWLEVQETPLTPDLSAAVDRIRQAFEQ